LHPTTQALVLVRVVAAPSPSPSFPRASSKNSWIRPPQISQFTHFSAHQMSDPVPDPEASAQSPVTKPQIPLTFLLVTGNRWTLSFDPEETIGRVKEIVWNEWPADWSAEQPPSHSFLRILYLGKILQDNATVASQFPSSSASTSAVPTSSDALATPGAAQPTIVHLSVRPFAPGPEDDIAKSKARRRGAGGTSGTSEEDGSRAGGCCGCVIC